MNVDRIHHVAYPSKDAKEAVLWHPKMLGMASMRALAGNEVSSTKAPDPCMQVFPDAGKGNVLASACVIARGSGRHHDGKRRGAYA